MAIDPGEMAAFQEIFARRKRKEKGQKCAKRFRKSDKQRELREKRIENLKAGLVPSTVTELQEMLANISGFLLSLQNRLKSWPGEF